MSQVLVIVPTYNERDNLPKIVAAVHEHLPEADLLIVDDNSPDGTGRAGRRARRERTPSCTSCTARASTGSAPPTSPASSGRWPRGYQYLFEMDCDFTHDPKYLPDHARRARATAPTSCSARATLRAAAP